MELKEILGGGKILDLSQKSNEEFFDYKIRLICGKIERLIDLDWSEIRDLLNLDCSPDHLRKTAYGIYECYQHYLNKKDNTTQSKLDIVREKVGELDILKRQIQVEKNDLSKVKRELIKSVAIADDLKSYFEDNFTINIPEYCNEKIQDNSSFEMVLHIADWHLGYIINDCKGNYYNWEIANLRVDKLILECYKYIEMYNIKKIYVVNTCDTIEHVYMRKNQSQFCEFNQSEQINKAIELIYRLLVALCKYCDVEYDSIYGNHDRMNGDKTANLDGDNAETIIREQLGVYKVLSNNNRLTVVNRKHTDKEIKKEIMGVKCKFIHGDNGKTKDGKSIIKGEISVDNEFYDILFKAHFHNFSIESENNGRYIVSTGCLSGYNDYSVNFYCSTFASQTIAILGEKKIELIKDVFLQYV